MSQSIFRSGVARNSLALIGLLVCGWGMWTSGRAGASREESEHARKARSVEAAQEAVRLSPGDPIAFAVRAEAWAKRNTISESVKDFKTAVTLRPEDYLLWLRLGYARERLEDREGALAAYQQAVRLAPYYGQPRWYAGNMLLDLGRKDEAFVELSRAAASNPDLSGLVFDLAWTAYNGDGAAVERAIRPQTAPARLALARFFVAQGRAGEAMQLFRTAGPVAPEEQRALVEAFLAGKLFPEAYAVWAEGRISPANASNGGVARIFDGGFEQEIILNDPGFGWDVNNSSQQVHFAMDWSEPHSGAQSLRLDWAGNSDPQVMVIKQLVLVEPHTRYRLHFAARTRELLSVSLPIVSVSDANDDKQSALAQSPALPRATTPWQDYSLEFTTAEKTSAVLIGVRREACNTYPCSILGNLWLDDFVLQRL